MGIGLNARILQIVLGYAGGLLNEFRRNGFLNDLCCWGGCLSSLTQIITTNTIADLPRFCNHGICLS